ncbi:MAG TPA: hypothetical protein VHY20_14575 [Pirellulales bacterium]|nr:hypothetical protein [Pirellulales bacterium]
MARGLDERKRREWADRLERRRASGVSVARFCAAERVSVNTFYYWSKRLGSSGVVKGATRADEAAGRAKAARAGALGDDDQPTPASAVVRFHLGGGVEVEVPAQALDAIRCLAQSAACPGAQPQRSGAFHEFVLGARR